MAEQQTLTPSPFTLSRDQFVAQFGGIYEHSPWVAQGLFDQGLVAADDQPEALAARMAVIVDGAGDDLKLALLRAHPELAGKLAVAGKLTEESKTEQSSAGLDQCTAQEFDRFQTLNTAYTAKFGFPFIIAVRGLNRHDILAAFETRVNHTSEREFQTALDQVHKIARLRLGALVAQPDR